MISVRKAGSLDCRPMADLLNAVISKGGTTAFTKPITADDIGGWMTRPAAVWHLAEDDKGAVVGFQYFNQDASLPPEAVSIATFAEVGRTGLGIGSKLFDVTREEAAKAGHGWICAKIRADNTGGRAYYQSRGFEQYGVVKDVTLGDGTVVDQVLTRFIL